MNKKAVDSGELTYQILEYLRAYEKAGIVSCTNLENVSSEYHPQNIMPDFQSVIVLAREPKDVVKENIPGKFHQAISIITAQDKVVRLLNEKGYKTQIIGSRSKLVSLPRLGEKAGVGELSPFSTLAVKDCGLRTVLSAIITDAPLVQSPSATGSCINKDRCLKRCAALDLNGVFNREKCTSCGACVKNCTV